MGRGPRNSKGPQKEGQKREGKGRKCRWRKEERSRRGKGRRFLTGTSFFPTSSPSVSKPLPMHMRLQCLVQNKYASYVVEQYVDNAVRPLLTVIYGYRGTYLQLLSQMSLVSHTHAIGRKRVTWDSLHNQKRLLLCYSPHASDVVHLLLDGHAVQGRLLLLDRAILVWLQKFDWWK